MKQVAQRVSQMVQDHEANLSAISQAVLHRDLAMGYRFPEDDPPPAHVPFGGEDGDPPPAYVPIGGEDDVPLVRCCDIGDVNCLCGGVGCPYFDRC